MKKKMMALALAGAMLAMTACGSSGKPADTAATKAEAAAAATEAPSSAATQAADNSGKTYKVGICQLTCATIVNGFVSNQYDLILANATPALQAAVAATTDIPILGTSITDYGTALNLKDFSGTTGMNVSGTSDLAPLDQQEAMIKELVPDAKKVAILYCSAEANSKFQAEKIEGYLDADKIAYQEYTFADSNDLQSVVQSAVSECDVMYIPTDNTAASNMTIIKNITEPAKLPIICGEENMCSNGGLATLSIDYYDIGKAAGEQAIDILANGADVSTMPIGYAKTTTKKYNKEYADAIGFTIPSDYVAIEK